MSINKFDFIEYSAARYGIDFSTAETFVDMFADCLSELLNAGHSVEIDGVGRFEKLPLFPSGINHKNNILLARAARKNTVYFKASDLVYDQDFLLDTLCDNYDVFFKHYACKVRELGETKSQILNQITDLLLLELQGKCFYFEPLIFNPGIALECGLIPLTTPNIRINNNSLYRSCKDSINVLILPSGTFLKIWTERLYPKLDAYQALTDNSIDEASLLFTDPEHFAAVVGKSLTRKVVNAVSNKSYKTSTANNQTSEI